MEKQKSLKTKGAIFDFDGTLFDLAVDWAKLKKELSRVSSSFGHNSTFTPLYPEIHKLLHLIRRRYDERVYKKQKERLYKLIKDAELQGLKMGSPKYYAKQILQTIIQFGIKVGVVTSNSSEVVRMAFQKHKWPSIPIVGREEVERLKPHPESIYVLLKKLHINPDSVCGIGDTYKDTASFQLAGIKKIFMLKDKGTPTDKKVSIYKQGGKIEVKTVVFEKIIFIKNLKELETWLKLA